MQERLVEFEEWFNSQITSEESAGCNGRSGSDQWQTSEEALCRKDFVEQNSDSILAASAENFSQSGESSDSSIPNVQSSNISGSPCSSLLLHEHRILCEANKHAGISIRSNRSFTTSAYTDDHTTITDYLSDDLQSNQLTSESENANMSSSPGCISGKQSLSEASGVNGTFNPRSNLGTNLHGNRPDQEFSANRLEFESPVSVGYHSTMALDGSSSSSASVITNSDSLSSLQVEASDLDAQAVDISSGMSRGELSGREARRNTRRRLWDALTRASRRRRFSSSIMLANENDGVLRAFDDGWHLFDLNVDEDSSNFSHESGTFLSSTSNQWARGLRPWPQFRAHPQLTNAMEGSSGQSRHCAFGLHQNGQCCCEAFTMTQESSTRASISRIVMLAEALFEVLDEIHRRSVSLSRSSALSLVSSPAPEAVVESLAVRVYDKSETAEFVRGQSAECYICLLEYEEGDHIRVLPCCHGFHKLCVDKWLKETHRVCPLCRHNVCGDAARD
ncbi:hypothetical protein KP509_32G063100 [Ceratopteris richardii]|nr:hypothetical protein KP509_32G063100 [Ceratopteris richardii]